MAFIRSQLFCVFVSVFVVFFCVDLAYRVEGDIIQRLATVGDDITLSCYRPDLAYDNYKNWYRNGTLIANYQGVVINDPRFKQATYYEYPDSNNIYISNVRINDSAIFQCRNFSDKEVRSYDLRVIRCSNCIIANHSHPDEIAVICTLDNYWTSQVLYKYIILNGIKYRKAVIIEGNTFYYSITMTQLNRLPSEFSLQIKAGTRITCMLPKNKNATSNKNTREGNITLITVISGSVFILILIVIIVLRWKKTKDRRENKHTGNATIKKETLEVKYESLENGSRNGPEYPTSIMELRETSLDQLSADHADKKNSPEVCYESVEDRSQQGPEYATSIMELRGTNHESKSTSQVTDISSTSDHLYGNNVIITRHEQNMDVLQQGDQYENVKMPGSGDDAEEILLYDMPDEGPTRSTSKATPEAGQKSTLSKDEVVSVDAEVD